MNKASRVAATINPGANPFQLRASLFHCTPVLERRRRTHWDSASSFKSTPNPKKFNQYHKRLRKESLLRNVSEFAEHLFQSWESDRNEYNQPPGRGSSWFRPNFTEDGYTRGNPKKRTSRSFQRDFNFCIDDDDDDVEFETFFRWSFTRDEEPRYKNSSSYSSNYKTSGGWKYQYDEEYDSSSDYEKPMTKNIASDRLALGLSASGPLNLNDVKTAYRACALKWHPDRHHGSSKAVAEEKFKVCSAAYQSLCDKLALRVDSNVKV